MPTKLVLPKEETDPYASDVERIIRVCATLDYEITADVARQAWKNYSEFFAAGWITLPIDDQSLLSAILSCTIPEIPMEFWTCPKCQWLNKPIWDVCYGCKTPRSKGE